MLACPYFNFLIAMKNTQLTLKNLINVISKFQKNELNTFDLRNHLIDRKNFNWGNNVDKNNKVKAKPKYIKIYRLSDEHLINIALFIAAKRGFEFIPYIITYEIYLRSINKYYLNPKKLWFKKIFK